MDVAALSFPLPDSPPSLPLPLPLPAEDDFDGMLVDAEINAATLQIWKYDLYAIVFPYGSMMGQNLSRQALELARCETKPKNKTEENEKHPVRRHSFSGREPMPYPELPTYLYHSFSTGPRFMLRHM
jgi:hypothetical protein